MTAVFIERMYRYLSGNTTDRELNTATGIDFAVSKKQRDVMSHTPPFLTFR